MQQGVLYHDGEEKLALAKLFEHRRLKPKLVELLKEAKQKVPQGKRLRASGQMNYSRVTEELQKAVENRWLTEEKIANTLGHAELSGNQHILLYEFPGNNASERTQFLNAIASPTGQSTNAKRVSHYTTVPRRSVHQIVSSNPDEAIVKIVAEREYWTENVLDESDRNRIVYEKIRHSERCPVIVKASIHEKLIQIRVSPRQKGDSGSARNHHDFAIKALSGHYDLDDEHGWFQQMTAIPLSSGFPAIVNDHSLLVEMWADSPEDRKVTSRFRNRGRPKLGSDLRKYKHWNHSSGYARKSLSGFFRCGSSGQTLFAHLHDDKIPESFGRDRVSRVFISRFCEDGEIEHAIKAIRAHI
ncbi:hypothetical protein [Crateriforma spongiae]|uniref:hypothetical protein n=1 Tax=Crateriforma spongiae TaxID=2724528 RepID=UPI0039B06011